MITPTEQRLLDLIAEYEFQAPPSVDSKLKADSNWDSLDFLEFTAQVEDSFEIELDDGEMAEISDDDGDATIAQLAGLVDRRLRVKAGV